MKIDVSLISGARPALLEATLRSVQGKILKHFDVATCYANIDLFGGTEDDRARCRDIITAQFPSAIITMPERPSFGMAVKTVWSQVRSPYVLHLEDDWEVLEDIRPEMVLPFFEGDTRAVKLVCKEMHWNGKDTFYERARKYKLFGHILWRSRRMTSVFGTGPAFFSSDFVRVVSKLMDPSLDPEKQMRPPNNPPLAAYVEQFRCRLLPGTRQHDIIRDTGREWREQKGIEKIYDGATITWKQAGRDGD